MKKLIYLLAVTLMVTGALAQAPNKMSYQTVIRNAGGALLTNQAVGMQISILQGSNSGTAVFVETHNVTTNANGLASLEIGGGTAVTGTIGSINWSAGPYFIKTETDPAGGTNYSITGTSELLSVPYALFSGSSTTNAWGLRGNTGTNTDSNFIGTIDSVDLKFRAYNQPAGLINVSGSDQSTALGYQTLVSNSTGIFNTALGYGALYSNTTGLSNAVVGNNALAQNTTGNLNSGVSAWALSANTTGSENAAMGYGALDGNSTGNSNSAMGAWALSSNRQGTKNTAIGYAANVADSNLTNATAIGADAVVGASNALVLGHNALVGIGTSSPQYITDIVGTGGPRLRVFSQDGYYAGILAKNNTHEYFMGVQGDYESAGGNNSGFHIYDNTVGARRMVIDANGNMGVGESAPVAKLDVAGNVKITDGTQGAGKVLTSDANGLAHWDIVSNPVFAESSCGSNTYFTVQGTVYNYACGQVNITVNRPGTVVVTATAMMIIDHLTGTNKTISLNIGNSPTDGGDYYSDTYLQFPASLPTWSPSITTYQVRRTFAVTPGSYTFYLNGQTVAGGSGNENFNYSHMEAILY